MASTFSLLLPTAIHRPIPHLLHTGARFQKSKPQTRHSLSLAPEQHSQPSRRSLVPPPLWCALLLAGGHSASWLQAQVLCCSEPEQRHECPGRSAPILRSCISYHLPRRPYSQAPSSLCQTVSTYIEAAIISRGSSFCELRNPTCSAISHGRGFD